MLSADLSILRRHLIDYFHHSADGLGLVLQPKIEIAPVVLVEE